MSEYEYYTNLPYVNFCKARGYEEKLETETAILRIGFYRVHQSLVQKPLSLTDFWPLPSDEIAKKDTLKVSREMLAAIKKAHNLK